MTASLAPSPTSLPNDEIGAQVPRVRVVPEGDDRLGREVVDFMAEIGRPLDPWQADCTRVAFMLTPLDLWAAYEFLLLLSRQNGKGGVTEAIELGSMYLFREPLLLHSAHQFKTSTAAFRRLQEIIDASDWLRRRVKMISRSKGDESIELTAAAGGSRLQFVARTLGSGRGLTGSKTIFDEAAWLTIGQFAAQTPTLATLPNPQIVYTSTPPDEDFGPMPEDAMLPSVRRRATAGAERTALFEWSPTRPFDRSDPVVWRENNPAYGLRISHWFLASQLQAFVDAGKPWKFDIEHLGLWPDDEKQQWLVIAEAEWSAAERPRAAMANPPAFGVWVAPDRGHAAIAAAGVRADATSRLVEITGESTAHGVVLDYRPGTGWVFPRLVEMCGRHDPLAVVTNDRGLADQAEGQGLDVHLASSSDQASASGMLFDGIVAAGDVRHLGQRELTLSVAGAGKRKVGQGWVWDQLGQVDVCPVGAASLALWASATPRVHRDKPVLPMAAYA